MPQRLVDPNNPNPNVGRGQTLTSHAKAAGAVVNPRSANGVWLPLFLAFGIKVVADWKMSPGKTAHHAAYKPDGAIASLANQNFGAWIVVFGGLFLMSDIESTNELATALAWLIFIGIALSKGEEALGHTGVFPNINNTKFSYLTKPKKG